MKRVWQGSIILATLVVCLLVLLAYFYRPPAADEQASYFREKDFDILDTRGFDFNSRKIGTGKPVVLIHGAGTWSFSFRHNVDDLATEGEVYSFDMPGHGYTKVKKSPAYYDLDYMSGAIEEYLNTKNLDKVSLVGHSFGGGWALYFAQQHPERVERLVLLAPRALDVQYKWEWRLMKYPVIGELFSKFFSRHDVRRGLEDAYFNSDGVTSEVVSNVFIPLTFSENRRAQYRLVRDSDWTLTEAGMATVGVPTLVLWGDADNYLSANQLDIFKERMPNVTTRVFDQCGHALHEECYRQVNPMVKDFIFSETRP